MPAFGCIFMDNQFDSPVQFGYLDGRWWMINDGDQNGVVYKKLAPGYCRLTVVDIAKPTKGDDIIIYTKTFYDPSGAWSGGGEKKHYSRVRNFKGYLTKRYFKRVANF